VGFFYKTEYEILAALYQLGSFKAEYMNFELHFVSIDKRSKK
jgi:hypothetical protein